MEFLRLFISICRVKFNYFKKRKFFLVFGEIQILMRIVRGMQRSIIRREVGWKKSFSRGIGVTLPKARARDKSKIRVLYL